MWNSWQVTGQTNPGDAFVRPWLDEPVTVVGYELTKVQSWTWSLTTMLRNYTESWFMLGSTVQPDAMLTLGPGHTHARSFWPAGSGQPWPSADAAVPTQAIADASRRVVEVRGDLNDIHGLCFGGGSIQIFLTIYYEAAALK